MGSEPEQLAYGDKPLGRVVLPPAKCVPGDQEAIERIADDGTRDSSPIIHGELMVEIMVPFPHREDGRDEVVARGMSVIVRCASKVVRNRIDAKCALS